MTEKLIVNSDAINNQKWKCDACGEDKQGAIDIEFRVEANRTIRLCSVCIDKVVSARIVAVLNRSIRDDRAAMESLFNVRVRCNELIAADPTIQVDSSSGAPYVGIIGLLSGIAGAHPDGYGKVAAVYEQSERSGIPSGLMRIEMTREREKKVET
jgi:hypothetical protein